MLSFTAELTPKNYEQKCLCILVLDTSGSMDGAAIEELNEGLQRFIVETNNDFTTSQRLEVAVITFNDEIEMICPPTLVNELLIPKLKANGSTRMVDAMAIATTEVERRKNYYKETGQPYYRPFVVMITDGQPNPDQNVGALRTMLRNDQADSKYTYYGVGVQGADLELLQSLGNAKMLQDLKFQEFFKWLSASMKTISNSRTGQTISLPSTDDWASLKI
ncbi:MAG: VWA domain-containing protein [Bacteroidota bacterium]|nr:VWA domain-containing protein [Bacteroidota bacterium]